MLPNHPVEPAFNTARQIKVSWVNAQHKALINNPVIEPIWQDKLKAKRVAFLVSDLFPLIEPTKVMVLFPLALPDARHDVGRPEPMQCGFQLLIVPAAGPAMHEFQEIIR